MVRWDAAVGLYCRNVINVQACDLHDDCFTQEACRTASNLKPLKLFEHALPSEQLSVVIKGGRNDDKGKDMSSTHTDYSPEGIHCIVGWQCLWCLERIP